MSDPEAMTPSEGEAPPVPGGRISLLRGGIKKAATAEFATAAIGQFIAAMVLLIAILVAGKDTTHWAYTISVAAVATGALPVTSGLANIAALLAQCM